MRERERGSEREKERGRKRERGSERERERERGSVCLLFQYELLGVSC